MFRVMIQRVTKTEKWSTSEGLPWLHLETEAQDPLGHIKVMLDAIFTGLDHTVTLHISGCDEYGDNYFTYTIRGK